MWRRKAVAPVLRCSFCHKAKNQVEHLVVGPHGVSMCETCVEYYQLVMQKEREKQPIPPR